MGLRASLRRRPREWLRYMSALASAIHLHHGLAVQVVPGLFCRGRRARFPEANGISDHLAVLGVNLGSRGGIEPALGYEVFTQPLDVFATLPLFQLFVRAVDRRVA